MAKLIHCANFISGSGNHRLVLSRQTAYRLLMSKVARNNKPKRKIRFLRSRNNK